jgi:hypothetical protein
MNDPVSPGRKNFFAGLNLKKNIISSVKETAVTRKVEMMPIK